MSIHRVEVVWNGLSGMPGLSVFYGSNGSLLVADLNTFFNAIKAHFPSGLTWQTPAAGDIIDEVTGTLEGEWSGGAASSISGTGGGGAGYAAGCGAYVIWGTATIAAGRRLKGRTFLCPIIGSDYDAQGTILSTAQTNFQTAANALVTAGNLKIWHRPKGGGGGGTGAVTSAVVPDQVTSLKSRRR